MQTEPAAERTRELWFTGPSRVEMRRGKMPSLATGTVLVQGKASGVSQGTEMLLFRGEGLDPFDPSLGSYAASRYPCRYGYAWVGEVIERAADVASPAMGTRVFALAPHGDLHLLPANQVRVLDSSIPAVRAVLAANLETAVNCVWDSGMSIGDHVNVFGAGVVGLLIAWLSVKAGADVSIVEKSEKRRTFASRLGIPTTVLPDISSSVHDADVAIEATGHPATLDAAVASTAQEGRVVVVSNYGGRSHPLNLGDHFHRRRLTLRSSQVSSIPAERGPRWTFDRRFELVKRLLADTWLDALLDNRVDFDDAPEVYAHLDARPDEHLQTVFVY
jgi:2-desacetyl-2-hydroxyethyl bacteriochlorophyllide A dehydrogenase